ncbi:hypothetical protein D1007_02340 [Hordeum vulgare]|nr:hypothetical protein D1007_02340 [Hordeum vulgare]
MVADPGGRNTVGLVEKVDVLLHEMSQQGRLGVGDGSRQLGGNCSRSATLALPLHFAPLTSESHGQGVEIPKDGSERPQEVDVEDEVEAAQVDAYARGGEALVADEDGNLPRNSMAAKTVTVSHGNSELLAARRLEGQATHSRLGQEVVCRACVQES